MPSNKGGIIRDYPLSMTNRGQWITQQRLTLIRVCLLWYHLIGQKRIDPIWWINWLISMQLYVAVQTNHQLTKVCSGNKLTRWFVYKWGKPTWKKPHRMNLRLPLPRIHYYQIKRLQVKESQYLMPTYSWTLTPIPNWTCSVVTISLFNAQLLVRD